MHILILIGVENGRINHWEDGQISIKNILLEVNFQVEGPLYANYLFFILAIWRKFLLFVCIQKYASVGEEMVIFWWKLCFWSLFSKMKVTCTEIACFIFSLFTVSSFFYGSEVMAYACLFQS